MGAGELPQESGWSCGAMTTGVHTYRSAGQMNVEGKSLIASVTFDPDDEFARAIERKYRNGFEHRPVGWDSQGRYQRTPRHIRHYRAGRSRRADGTANRGLASIGEKLIELTDEPDTPVGDDAEAVWQRDSAPYGAGCSRPPLTTRSTTRSIGDCAGHTSGSARRRRRFPAIWTSSGWPSYGAVPRRRARPVPELFTEPSTQPDDDALVRLHEIMMKGPNDGKTQEEMLQRRCDPTGRIETGVNDAKESSPRREPAHVRCRLPRRSG